MADIDVLLSASLKRIAQPGDAAGVADAIRARVDAGDTGTPASSSGFGAGVGSWLPWVGIVLVAGVAGGAVGLSGLAGHPVVDQVQSASSGAVQSTTPGLLCVDGPAVLALPAGERVIATARDEQSTWLGVRNPVTLVGTVWVPVAEVVVDDGQGSIDSLPVGGSCPTVVVAVDPAPVIAAPAPDAPVSPANPSAPDTTAPGIGQGSASPNPIHQTGFSPDTSTVTVFASDDVGVVSVTANWPTTGPIPGGSANLSQNGSSWSFAFGPYSIPGSSYVVPVTVTAVDAAGNQSSTVVSVTVEYLRI